MYKPIADGVDVIVIIPIQIQQLFIIPNFIFAAHTYDKGSFLDLFFFFCSIRLGCIHLHDFSTTKYEHTRNDNALSCNL